MSLRKTFAANVKLFRKEKNLTQAQLAEKCDIATNYMGEIEKEKKFPSVDVIEGLAAALEIQPYILFYERRDENSDDRQLKIKWKQEEKEQISQEISEAVRKILGRH